MGDNASTCFIELVDYNDLMLKDKTPAKAKTRRSTKKSVAGKGSATATAEVVETSAPKKEPKAKESKAKVEEVKVEETIAETPVEPIATEVSSPEDKE